MWLVVWLLRGVRLLRARVVWCLWSCDVCVVCVRVRVVRVLVGMGGCVCVFGVVYV